jgi:DNA-binding MarR family transcriptional regulator
MPKKKPTTNLEKLFHEPNRIAILSALANADEEGLSFGELRVLCRLTDGNLNRHLAALEEEGIVRVKKAFVDRKPRTTILPTTKGLDRFAAYLAALERVLKEARDALPARNRARLAALRRATA